MREKSRTINSLRNFAYSGASQVFSILLAFVARTFFIRFLSKDYLGISGLFTNILSVLSVTELGLSSAITFCLYKPLAENDYSHINAIIHFYKKAYKYIGFFVLCVGMALMPFLNLLLKGNTSLVNVRIVFAFYIMETVTSYWFFAYKATLLKADQKMYTVTVYEQIVALFRATVRILLLFLLKNIPELSFYVYTFIGVVANIMLNTAISIRVDKEYPFLKGKNDISISPEEKQSIFKNVSALFFTKISYVVNESVDHLILTTAVGVATEAIYTNYAYLLSIVNGVIRTFAVSISASLGNYATQKNEKEQYSFFKKLDLIYFWLYGFGAICFWELLNPFISIWAGEEYLFPKVTVLIIVIYFVVPGLFTAVPAFQNAKGLYWQTRVIPISSVCLNVFLSVLFTAHFEMGINGILGATILARLFVELPFTVLIVFKNAFKKNGVGYLVKYLFKTILLIITALIIDAMFHFITLSGFGLLIVKIIVCIIVVNTFWILIFRKTESYRGVKETVSFLMRKVKL